MDVSMVMTKKGAHQVNPLPPDKSWPAKSCEIMVLFWVRSEAQAL